MGTVEHRIQELERVALAATSAPRVLIANRDNVDRAMAYAKATHGEDWHPAVIVPPKDRS